LLLAFASSSCAAEGGAVNEETVSELANTPRFTSEGNSASPAIKRDGPILRGVNLSGGEFGSIPGQLGHDYIYPSNQLIDAVSEKGFRLIRIPFRWERLQPRLYGDFADRDLAALDRIVSHADARGMVVVLDLHNYARRLTANGSTALVGTSGLPDAALADFWEKLGGHFRDRGNVWIGLMNEPNGLEADEWFATAQTVVNHLRANGISNLVLVPGTAWTGAWSWLRSGNARAAEDFRDPGKNTIFEVHQYLDTDSSGTSGECQVGSSSRVDEVIAWAERGKYRLFFGEIAAGAGRDCKNEYLTLLRKLRNSQSAVGWAAWGGGPWWPVNYHFRLTFDAAGPRTAHDAYLSQVTD